MKTIEAVPVFYLGQDSSCDEPCQLVSREEAREMKKAQLGWFIDHGKAFRLLGRAPVGEALPTERPSSMETAATISLSEMRANVGIVDDRVKKPREAVRAARAKVRLYPHILDSLAPIARGSWLNPESLTVTAQA